MKMNVPIDGRRTEVEIAACRFHVGGEFDGNLDFEVNSATPLPLKALLAALRARPPGSSELFEVAGYREREGGVDVSLYSDLHGVDDRSPPTTIEVFWLEDGRELASVQVPVELVRGGEDAEPRHAEPAARGGCGAAATLLIAALLLAVSRLG